MPKHRNHRAAASAATNHRDTLDAIADGNVLHGLGGRDLLRSDFNHTELFGDGGRDRLVTKLNFDDIGPVSARQFGGGGHDVLKAYVGVSAYSEFTSEIVQEGGSGNDKIVASNFVFGELLRRRLERRKRRGDDPCRWRIRQRSHRFDRRRGRLWFRSLRDEHRFRRRR